MKLEKRFFLIYRFLSMFSIVLSETLSLSRSRNTEFRFVLFLVNFHHFPFYYSRNETWEKKFSWCFNKKPFSNKLDSPTHTIWTFFCQVFRTGARCFTESHSRTSDALTCFETCFLSSWKGNEWRMRVS